MKIILLSGLGPTWPAASSFWDSDTLAGTFFDRKSGGAFHSGLGRHLSTADFVYETAGALRPVFRPRLDGEPHLTSETLSAILEAANRDHELFRLEDVWDEKREPVTTDPDVVALSTTFICNRRALRAAVHWVEARYPRAKLVVGGQYSNLKYERLMQEYPRIDFIIRGDGELALPMLLDALELGGDLAKVPNLVFGAEVSRSQRSSLRLADEGARRVIVNPLGYVDLEAHPSPRFHGRKPIVPYESMRGCPFTCKFCSFPFASPEWRYKSAEKISSDWAGYAEKNGSTLIRAMDSTFTVPPSRFRRLLELLPAAGVRWEAYTRANVITGADVIEGLEASHCSLLSIGFESMSEASLERMNKKVRAVHNARAQDLLAKSAVDFRGSFMIGYPGETPEEYAETHRYLVDSYARHFMLSVFSLTDETMPVWGDAERFSLEVPDTDDPDSDWRHVGMDVGTARGLHRHTLREVRWKNSKAVAVIWQIPYQAPIIPERSLETNYLAEKLFEQLAFAPKDFADEPDRVAAESHRILGELGALGIQTRRAASAQLSA